MAHYDRYQPIWNMDKVAFIRRYASTQRPLSSFDMDITRYKSHQQDIQSEDPSHTVKFIRIDCTSLKQSLIVHCQQWQVDSSSPPPFRGRWPKAGGGRPHRQSPRS